MASKKKGARREARGTRKNGSGSGPHASGLRPRASKECPLTAGMPDTEDLIAELPTTPERGLKPLTAADVFRRTKKKT